MKYKQQFLAHPKLNTLIHWGKLISITGSAQLIVQAVGFISGILIIRLLPVHEYALYTIANTMLGTMTILADGGITAGVMAQGGKVWQDKDKLGSVLATGLDLRKKFAVVSLLISVPILVYLLQHNGASLLMTLLITLALIPAFWAVLSDSLLEVVPKLHQTILPLQKNQLAVSLFRLFMTAVCMFIFPWAFVAVLAAGIPRIWGNFQLKKNVNGLINVNKQPDEGVRKEVLTLVKRIMPTSIYYCLSGQISIWLISLFGNSTSVAQLGALGRFGMLFNLISVLMSTLLIPRFARITNNSKLMVKRFVQVQLFLIAMGGIFVFCFFVFKTQLLWVLGHSYKGLNTELLLISISASLELLSSTTNNMLTSQSITIPPILFIIIRILIQITTLFIIPVHTVSGVILFGITAILSLYITRIVYFVFQIKKRAIS
jgi:O-antigen/teichoic acid export membrane protein